MDDSIQAEIVEIPGELKELKKLSRTLFESKVNELFFLTIDEMKERTKSKDASVIDIWLMKLVVNGSKEGDLKSLQFLLDRVIGPLPTSSSKSAGTIDASGNMNWVQYIEQYGSDELPEED